MAETEIVENFKQGASTVLEWRSKKNSLIERDNWGDHNFKESESLIDRILKMTDDLATLPVELTDDGTLSQLGNNLAAVAGIFERIDAFTTADMVANPARDSKRDTRAT